MVVEDRERLERRLRASAYRLLTRALDLRRFPVDLNSRSETRTADSSSRLVEEAMYFMIVSRRKHQRLKPKAGSR